LSPRRSVFFVAGDALFNLRVAGGESHIFFMNLSRSLKRFPALRGLAIRLFAGFAVFALLAGGPVSAVAALAAEHSEKAAHVEHDAAKAGEHGVAVGPEDRDHRPERHQPAAPRAEEQPGGVVRAGEHDAVDTGVGDEVAADVVVRAVDELDDVVGDAGSMGDADDLDADRNGLRRRLQLKANNRRDKRIVC